MPTGRATTGLPLIVMPHGGPHARDTWDFDRDVQFLASRGYAVLQSNFRGSTGYGKAFVEKGYGQWGRAMQDDVDDGLDWLIKSGKVDPRRVCIFGTSYGGYAAIWGAIRNPERYRCAISMAGVTDIPAMLRYDRRLFNAPRYFRDWQRKVQGDGADLRAVSPVAQAERLNVPLLVAQGEKDTIVPPEQARALLSALKKSPAPVESVFYPDAAHGFDKPDDRIDFYRRLQAFLTKYNPS
jgi:dipeptidyl aminopeptidase/acylaminoacyl peptidase